MMGLAAAQGKDPWHVTRAPASLLIGPDAVHPAGFVAPDVALGLAMHAVLGALVGVLYAALLPRLRLSPVAGGLVAGGVLYLLGSWVLPTLFPVWLSAMSKAPVERLVAAATHAVYGVVFGLAYRAFGGRTGPATSTTTIRHSGEHR